MGRPTLTDDGERPSGREVRDVQRALSKGREVRGSGDGFLLRIVGSTEGIELRARPTLPDEFVGERLSDRVVLRVDSGRKDSRGEEP